MIKPINGVVTGALIQQVRMQILANNLANLNTPGFKEDRVIELTADAADRTPLLSPRGTTEPELSVYGSLPVSTATDFSQGTISFTGNPLDFALEGSGFFAVQTPDAVKYTRDGGFSLNADQVLVTRDGYPVLGENGEIRLDGRQITVDATGRIATDGQAVDTFRLAAFPENNQLKKVGQSLFVPVNPQTPPGAAENIVVQQSSLEQSNVDAVVSMTKMIDVMRGFEAYQKVMQIMDKLDSDAVSRVGEIS